MTRILKDFKQLFHCQERPQNNNLTHHIINLLPPETEKLKRQVAALDNIRARERMPLEHLQGLLLRSKWIGKQNRQAKENHVKINCLMPTASDEESVSANHAKNTVKAPKR